MAAAGATLAATKWTIDSELRRHWLRPVELPDPCFYLHEESVDPGTAITVAHHATNRGAVSIARLGVSLEPALVNVDLPAQVSSPTLDHWDGFDWETTEIPVPSDARPGLYLVELRTGERFYRQLLIVRSTKPAAVGVVLSTITWHAYNDFGGFSNYRDSVTPHPLRELRNVALTLNWRLRVGDRHHLPSVPLPLRRPNKALADDLVDLEADPRQPFSRRARSGWALVRFLERSGVDVAVFGEQDLASHPLVDSCGSLVIGPHAEYWSTVMKGRMVAFAEGGKPVVFVSGNSLYREVRVDDRRVEVVDDRIDPRAAEELLGVSYTSEGYETFAPFRCVRPDHPLFAGTGVGLGDVFAGESDQGASGFETDKIGPASGPVELLAIGTNPSGPAYLTVRRTPAGGSIVHFSSVATAPWLEHDPTLGAIVLNAIA
ncbi:MAG: N,N-dimethylformamidase beta subunit family domain-containing protein [Acidimicrobiales bacterium]